MSSQKEAVVNIVLSVLASNGIDYELGGEKRVKDIVTSDMKAEMRSLVFEGFKTETIGLTAESAAKYLNDDTELKKYVNNVLNNWINKHPEFNAMFPESGGVYRAKNPGSRTGQGDEQIRELRKLRKLATDPESIAEIDEAIATRQAEIKPAKSVTINVEALPEHLRRLVPNQE